MELRYDFENILKSLLNNVIHKHSPSSNVVVEDSTVFGSSSDTKGSLLEVNQMTVCSGKIYEF